MTEDQKLDAKLDALQARVEGELKRWKGYRHTEVRVRPSYQIDTLSGFSQAVLMLIDGVGALRVVVAERDAALAELEDLRRAGSIARTPLTPRSKVRR